MAGFEQTYEGGTLDPERSVLVFLITCDKTLQTFLKEKGKMTLKEMSLAAATYIDAHRRG